MHISPKSAEWLFCNNKAGKQKGFLARKESHPAFLYLHFLKLRKFLRLTAAYIYPFVFMETELMFLATLVALHFTPVSESVSES